MLFNSLSFSLRTTIPQHYRRMLPVSELISNRLLSHSIKMKSPPEFTVGFFYLDCSVPFSRFVPALLLRIDATITSLTCLVEYGQSSSPPFCSLNCFASI